jgi:hypothetical protein
MRSFRVPTGLVAAALVLWAAVAVGGYYVWHKPFTAEQALAAGSAMIDLLVAAAVSTAAGGVGHRLLPRANGSPIVQSVLQLALGFGVLSLIWMALGAAGLWHAWLAWLALVLTISIVWRDAVACIRNLGTISEIWARATGLERVLAVMCVFMLVARLAFALAPPFEWDALVYHLELPRIYLDAGRLVFVPYNPYWGQPQLVEMLFTWAMALHGLTAATALAWLAGVLVPMGVLGWAAEFRTENPIESSAMPAAGWLAAVVVSASPTFRATLSNGSVDDFSALYGLCVAATLLLALRETSGRWLLWAGVFAGFAVGVKLTAGIALLALAPIVVSWYVQSGRKAGQLLLAAGLGALVACPWLIKNAIFTGDPLYPYLMSTSWVDERRLAYFTYAVHAGDSPLWLDLILPLRATWLGVPGTPGFATDIGPLLLWLVLPAAALFWRDRLVRLLIASLGVGWLLMAIAGRYSPLLQQTRLYFGLLPLAAVAAGLGWEALQAMRTHLFRVGRIASALVVFVLALGVWQEVSDATSTSPASVIFGTRTSGAYLRSALGSYYEAGERLAELPADAKVLALWEPRALYLPGNVQADSWIDRWYLDRRTLAKPASILQSWRAQGYTHMLLARRGAEFERQTRTELDSSDWVAFDELIGSLPQPRHLAASYELYDLTPEDPTDPH